MNRKKSSQQQPSPPTPSRGGGQPKPRTPSGEVKKWESPKKGTTPANRNKNK